MLRKRFLAKMNLRPGAQKSSRKAVAGAYDFTLKDCTNISVVE